MSLKTKAFLYIIPFTLIVLFSCGSNNDKIQPSVTSISESVYSSVTVQPDSLYQVFAAVSGILDKNLVEEGDSVQKRYTRRSNHK